MKTVSLFLISLTLVAQTSQAAIQKFDVRTQRVYVEDGRTRRESQKCPYGFQVEVISDEEGTKSETLRNGRPFIAAHPGERYAIRLYNPLPVRVAVNLTVDGINTISGKPSGISDGEKWLLDPYATVTIRGWQVKGDEARRFFFTEKPSSYAAWRGQMLKKDLARNVGVIGAAFFWNQQELDQYYEARPIYLESKVRVQTLDAAEAGISGYENRILSAPAAKRAEKAGTGMGERESHPTIQVAFNCNQGMYRLSDAVVIYYDFDREINPNPFPEVSFAPEMP